MISEEHLLEKNTAVKQMNAVTGNTIINSKN